MKWLFAATMLATIPSALAGQNSKRKCDGVPIDTLGVPELSTVELVSSNNSAFAEAVRVTLSGLRYEPARIQKAAVRQMAAYRQSAALRVTVSSSRTEGAPSGRPPRC